MRDLLNQPAAHVKAFWATQSEAGDPVDVHVASGNPRVSCIVRRAVPLGRLEKG